MDRNTAVANFQQACHDMKETGFNVVAVTVRYEEKDAHFNTILHLHPEATPEAHLTEDHIVLDAIREITQQWSQIAHK